MDMTKSGLLTVFDLKMHIVRIARWSHTEGFPKSGHISLGAIGYQFNPLYANINSALLVIEHENI